MVKKSLVYLQIPLIAVTLAGCLATTDLATDPTTDFTTQGIAQKISQLASDRCIRYTYDPTSGQKTSGDSKLYNRVAVKKLLKSSDDWYMATISADGVWGNVYYNHKSIDFICGQKAWDSYADSKKYVFTDVSGVQQKLLTKVTPRTQEKINVIERSIAISWDGYRDLLVGVVKMEEGASSGTMSVPIPSTNEVCRGTYNFKSRNEGTWAISCTNSMSAAGVFQTFGANNGSSGSGTDAKGNSVKYTISGS